MKKVLALIAIVGFVACNSAETAAPAVDTTVAPAVEAVVDTAAAIVDTAAAAMPAAPATEAK